ncbi:MAG: glycosyltransferase family 2 protein [Promethearchaeia archaeon]
MELNKEKMNDLVSIIIVNYNKFNYTIDCLKSLLNQTYDNFEIILIDNGSDFNLYLKLKDSISQLESKLNIKLIRNKINLFFGTANNQGIRIAKGKYICLLNFDTEVMPNFIESMINFLESHPEAGMISPKIKIYKDKRYIWNAGGIIDFRKGLVVFNRGFMDFDPNDELYNKIEETDFAAGTALFVKKENLEEIGLIDEIFFMYWEDPDWSLRAKKAGFKNYYVPNTIVYHKVPINNKERGEKRVLFNYFFFKRNKQIFIWKHAQLVDLFFFYKKYFYHNFIEILYRLKYREFFMIYFLFISLWKGLKTGFKRRFNISCRRNLIKDFRFIYWFKEIIEKK